METLFDRLITIRCKLEAGYDLSEEERDTLNSHYNANPQMLALADWSEEELKDFGSIYESTDKRYLQFREQYLQDAIKEDAEVVELKKTRSLQAWALSAAAAAVLIAGGFWIYRSATVQRNNAQTEKRIIAKNDILPGSVKAILTLADGRQIALDSSDNFETVQGNTRISQPKSGQLAYNEAVADQQTAQPIYNTVRTPNGGRYELILPDGTKIWLNAGSSIRFPVAFTGGERKVEISGEVYFEAAHKQSPFQVMVNNTMVEARGTTFNIMAYGNEEGNETTLLDGEIIVISENDTVPVTKGQQVIVRQGSAPQTVRADVESVAAWKNNEFYLKDKKLNSFFRQIERWYDAKVDVKDPAIGDLDITFGPITRNIPVSAIFDILERNNHLTYKIDGNGRIIMVYKKEQSAHAGMQQKQKSYLASIR